MSVHSFHPDSHTHGLADNCERCAEHAANVYTLDNDNLRALYELRQKVEADVPGFSYRSQNEQTASYNLGCALRITSRLLQMGALPYDP